MIRVRLLPPVGTTSPVAVNGRTFEPDAADYQDVLPHDAVRLEAAGWVRVAAVGSTADRPRPVPPSADEPIRATRGAKYIDSTLGAVLAFDGLDWRDALTGAAA